MTLGERDESRPDPGRPGRGRRRVALLSLLGLGLMAAGVGSGILIERQGVSEGLARVLPGGRSATEPVPRPPHLPGSPASAAPEPRPPAPPPAEASAAPVEVVLTPEAMGRVGIRTARVSAAEGSVTVQVPGTVVANAYREVKVTPIVPGIVTHVHVELGAVVGRGDPLVTLSSTELADAQTRYLSMAAMLEADQKKLGRTRQLVEIGAASRQDLEEVGAVHDSRATELAAARQRLLQLGLRAEQVEALRRPEQVVTEVVVPAPIDGVVTARAANLGQVVALGQELTVVTDLAVVWVLGDLYEQDFAAVRVGTEATVTIPAYPGLTLPGRVAYIDPRVDPQARTAKVRVELQNPGGRLRLGMYVTLDFRARGGARAVLVPRAAVQTLGDRHVVFIPARDEQGRFLQRDVRLGAPAGPAYTVLEGLRAGEVVVTEGSFFLRSESVRNAPGG